MANEIDLTEQEAVKELVFELRTYDQIVKTMTATKNRMKAFNQNEDPAKNELVKKLNSMKDKLSRNIEKKMNFWPIWTEWLVNVKQAGPFICGNLIICYYYKQIPICKKCYKDLNDKFKCEDEKHKHEGIFLTRLDRHDFPTISKWWHYCGVHTVDGFKPDRRKGSKNTWSARARQAAWSAGNSFKVNAATHDYGRYYLGRMKKREKTHPDKKEWLWRKMSMNETSKLFLSHFWLVARYLEGKPLSDPYAGTILKHTNIIKPYGLTFEATESQYPDSLDSEIIIIDSGCVVA